MFIHVCTVTVIITVVASSHLLPSAYPTTSLTTETSSNHARCVIWAIGMAGRGKR
jgi:hypothetical protein